MNKHLKTVYTEPKLERPIERKLLKEEFDIARGIMEMHTYRRPAGTKSERRFIDRFLNPLGLDLDQSGNLYKRIGTAPVLWSCHTDTVHREGGRQKITVCEGMLRLHAEETRSNCLGSDDGGGVWLMTEMIKAKKEGLYIFHRGEERGGIGSRAIAKYRTHFLADIEMAIAFDRMGYDSVITHQFDKTASDDFAWSLAQQLNDHIQTATYRPDDTGIFTDTANYADLIPECTNISIGNHHQHSEDETVDLPFLIALRNAVLELDIGKLIVARKPGDRGEKAYGSFKSKYNEKDGTVAYYYEGEYEEDPDPKMQDVILDYTEELALFLEDYNLSPTDLRDELRKYREQKTHLLRGL